MRTVTAVTLIAVIVACIWIMVKRAGLSDELDFGAGAYYYSDIPEFYETFGVMDAFKPALPYILYVLLFLAWGALMYWVWTRIDRRK